MDNKGWNCAKLESAMLVATFFSLWLAVYFEDAIEDVFGYVLILSFGILHGANDIKLLQATTTNRSRSLPFIKILGYYVGFVLSVAALFYLIPAISLALFIVFSAYHFGEQHWTSKIKSASRFQLFFYTAYGLLVLLLLFSAHGEEVSDIVLNITAIKIPISFFQILLAVISVLVVILYMVISKNIKSKIILELFYLLVFFIIFNTASLLWAFAIYFIIWHAIPSLAEQMQFLYGDISKSNFIKYIRSSAVYWGISVVALVVLFVFIEDAGQGFLPFLFSFLAAITFPHVFVINRLKGS
ncbi:MAG: Brp/Blh family beta-carotene 15,15'-dioxygenase [Eudoraea sp.]|nr:Brp/Blh family beta-carotene 15,15'-dioxygenase [Eudoraea sp.]